MSKIIHTNVGVGIETLEEFTAEEMHELIESEDGNILVSIPPVGCYKITNLYCEKIGESYHFVYRHLDTPEE